MKHLTRHCWAHMKCDRRCWPGRRSFLPWFRIKQIQNPFFSLGRPLRVYQFLSLSTFFVVATAAAAAAAVIVVVVLVIIMCVWWVGTLYKNDMVYGRRVYVSMLAEDLQKNRKPEKKKKERKENENERRKRKRKTWQQPHQRTMNHRIKLPRSKHIEYIYNTLSGSGCVGDTHRTQCV